MGAGRESGPEEQEENAGGEESGGGDEQENDRQQQHQRRQSCAGQVENAEEERLGDQLPHGRVRVEVDEGKEADSCQDHPQQQAQVACQHEELNAAGHALDEQQVCGQQKAQRQRQQPDRSSPLEAAAESTEKVADAGVRALCHVSGTVIQGGEGGACGEDRQTAQQEQKAHHHAVK